MRKINYKVEKFVFSSPVGILCLNKDTGVNNLDTLRKDITEILMSTNESEVVSCFQFNKYVYIEVKNDLQIETEGWTNIEEAIKTGTIFISDIFEEAILPTRVTYFSVSVFLLVGIFFSISNRIISDFSFTGREEKKTNLECFTIGYKWQRPSYQIFSISCR
jgi:hypothetical protein